MPVPKNQKTPVTAEENGGPATISWLAGCHASFQGQVSNSVSPDKRLALSSSEIRFLSFTTTTTISTAIVTIHIEGQVSVQA
ncbi:hypothetical protein GYMLUDRAFT_49198 [Collybiopsis luxurians FD-317 M1]|uniref:Uncharacterized protein n=1 Tax=Collybiopsis luxurians FD-317 M1 TaxID=944289 RepID=A0A0D0BGE8_9AGAR|nr:hypothetical protein GYMLUDRAFT_49198 [Collybiopsis luxurians FD-317 M1]